MWLYSWKQSFIVLVNKILVNYQRKKNNSHNMDYCKCCDTHILWFPSHVADFTINCSQNIGVDITFSVLSCLVQEIWHKIHNLVMAESKMVAMATTRCFCDGSISENVQGPKLYKCTKFHAFMKKWTLFSHITWTSIDILCSPVCNLYRSKNY